VTRDKRAIAIEIVATAALLPIAVIAVGWTIPLAGIATAAFLMWLCEDQS